MNTKNGLPAAVSETILESIADGVFTVDRHWRIMSFNRAAERITGILRSEAIGRFCWEVFRANMCDGDCALKRTMKVGKSFVNSSTFIIDSARRQIPITVSTALLKHKDGTILGGVETFRDHRLVAELPGELSTSFRIGDMVSRSPAMRDLFNILEPVACSDSTVLITGETGTGKGLLARAIHNLSRRNGRPFIGVNCGALPDTLLESELFGYKAGAFTDARTDKPGLFAAARDGTILLDEIGDTSPGFQIRLLRVLEEREFRPLGSTSRVKTDARIIAATNRDLDDMVRTATFRRDLFYRINIVTLALPPLRERREDIPLLIEHFIARMNRATGKLLAGIDSDALTLLLEHDYPGNIRELENCIEHAFILCAEGRIGTAHLPSSLRRPPPGSGDAPSLHGAVKNADQEVIITALKRSGFNRTAAAALLGMHKSTLYRKIGRLGLELPDRDGRARLS